MPRLHLTVALVAAAALTAPSAARADTDAVAALTEGVRLIDSPGTPGSLALVSENAFPIVVGRSGKDLREPIVAAAVCRRGRVVAFAHGGFLGAAEHDTPRLLRNAITWVAGRRKGDETLRVGFHGFKPRVMEGLSRDTNWRTASLDDPAALREADVLILGAGNIDDAWVRDVSRWVRGGGGLVVAATGWGWQQIHSDRDLATDAPMNRLGRELGIVWTNGTVRDTARNAFVVEPDLDPARLNAALLLETLVGGERTSWSADEKRQVERTLVQAVRATDPKGGPLSRPLAKLRRRAGKAAVPTKQRPVRAEDVAARVTILLDLEQIEDAEPRTVRAHPAARTFPGLPEPGARGVTKELVVDLAVPRWHSTGLYAPPGQPITIESTGDRLPKGLAIRIGCHKDWLGNKDTWKRMPGVTSEQPFAGPSTTMASAFGGLVYVVVPKKVKAPRPVTFTISGAIPAPTYVHGVTDLDEWRRVERRRKAPWGELICDRVILSLPSGVLRTLDDPDDLMDVWTRVLDACADLAQRPRERTSPERIVTDVQISAGYMHSGYPIMAHLDKQEEFANTAQLLRGSWGIYHELGHNHQSGLWTFGGTTEVTCNLFALYVYDTVCGKGLDSDGLHGGIVPAKRVEHIETAYGPVRGDFERWKRKPFIALTMYVQLAEAFGWDAYKTVFAEYRDLPPAKRPKNDAQKRDQWMVRFSRHVGRNLGPFFESWGVPTSASARAQVADLPRWEP